MRTLTALLPVTEMARFKVQETLVLKSFGQRPEHLKAVAG